MRRIAFCLLLLQFATNCCATREVLDNTAIKTWLKNNILPREENEVFFFVNIRDWVRNEKSEQVIELVKEKLFGSILVLSDSEGIQMVEPARKLPSMSPAYNKINRFYDIRYLDHVEYGDFRFDVSYEIHSNGWHSVNVVHRKMTYKYGWSYGLEPAYRIFPREYNYVRCIRRKDFSEQFFADKIIESLVDFSFSNMIPKPASRCDSYIYRESSTLFGERD